jgi:hypothetical protein
MNRFLNTYLEKKHSESNAREFALILNEYPEIWKDVIEILEQNNQKNVQRLSWALTKLSSKGLEIFIENLNVFLDLIESKRKNNFHNSLHRAFFKLMNIITEDKYLHFLNKNQLDRIIELSFDYLIDKSNKAAIRVYCIYTLNNLSKSYNWIENELKEYLRLNFHNELPSFKAASKRVLQKE